VIVPKEYKYNKACVLIYLNKHFDVDQIKQNFEVNCAVIYNPCFEMLNEVVEKLKEQGLEIRIVVTEDDYGCLHDLKNVDFDIIELNPYGGNIKAKNLALALKKRVEVVIDETEPKEVNRELWNLQNVKTVYVKKELEGRITEYDNVVYV